MEHRDEPIVETASLPSVVVIKNEWKRDNVITFLRRNLDLDEEDIGIFRSKKVSGKDFLNLTTKKLENYGLKPGPASRVAELVKKIKGRQIDVKNEWKRDNVIEFLLNLKGDLDLDEEDIGIFRSKKFSGKDFLDLTAEKLQDYGMEPGPASRIEDLVKEIKKEDLVDDLRSQLFMAELDNTRTSASIYRYVLKYGEVGFWDFEMDIEPMKGIGQVVFNGNKKAPNQGLKETKVNQPFCYKVLKEINDYVFTLETKGLTVVLGDYGQRLPDKIYADIIVGDEKFYSEFKKNPPNLSKGLGWEVKSDIIDGTNSSIGKGQLIKYARAYLAAERPLTPVFYGCLTDGKLWSFVKIQFILVGDRRKVKYDESGEYTWNEKTASLIAGLLRKYYEDLLNNEEAYRKNGHGYLMPNPFHRNKPLLTSDSLLASFTKEGTYIRLKSGKFIHVQITSFLGSGRECIVFLVQVPDHGIKDAVLKIEFHKNPEISPQICHEILALHALDDLSCIPKILFEGHTRGGSLALLTDFAGQPLESWLSNNGNIDDYTIFRIILDLFTCLEKIHAHGYIHGDVAIRNTIQRNGHFYLIDFGFATLLQLLFDPCQAIIQDYIDLCQIIGIIKFEKEVSLLELIDRLKGKLKSFVVTIENASRWKIADEKKWLEKFRQLTENNIL